MIKRIFLLSLYLFSLASFASTNMSYLACTNAVPTDNANFCASFRIAAPCYCAESGLPAGMCQDMTKLYERMIAAFGSLKKACEYQRYTSPQDCMDNWNCFRLGGTNSQGRLCSSTGKACS